MVRVHIDREKAVNGVSRTSEFAVRLERFGILNGLLAAKELAVLSDGRHVSGRIRRRGKRKRFCKSLRTD